MTAGVTRSRAPSDLSPERARAANHAWIAVVIIGANAVVVVGLWLRHGGVANATGPGGLSTAAGQLTALVGTYCVLVQLLLLARVPWLEQYLGLDRLAVWHRWNGFAAVTLLLGHTVLTTVGYASSTHQSLWNQTREFVSHYPDVLMAFVGLALLVAVAVTSVRYARRRLRRETWYFVHLYAYLAVALGFAHQLAVGTDFTDDQAARIWWVALYAVVLGSIIAWRVIQPLRFNARQDLRVSGIDPEAPGVVSISITGRHLRQVGAQPGQFFLWRFLMPDGWWQAHPFSLSARPTERRLRITVKALGDHSARLQSLRRGTRVFAEGPYGAFTQDRHTGRRVLLLAGGIGITPLRALMDVLPSTQREDMTLVFRVASDDDVIFRAELTRLAAKKRAVVHILVGAEIGDDQTDQLSLPVLANLVPDIVQRDCFVCGPPGFIDAMRRRLRILGVPSGQIHFERFEF